MSRVSFFTLIASFSLFVLQGCSDVLSLSSSSVLPGLPRYQVVYDGNGATSGTAPAGSTATFKTGASATVLANTGTFRRAGFALTAWNTASDGSGTTYQFGDTLTIGSTNLRLYAVWTTAYDVTYDGNGSTGGSAPTDASSPYVNGATVAVRGKGNLVRQDFAFLGWNTAADGSGTDYEEDDTFTIATAAVTLYAQWARDTVFVAPTGDDAADGSRTTPVATLGQAITLSSSVRNHIKMQAGTYTLSSGVNLKENAQLLGGFDSSWNRDITANETTIDVQISTSAVNASSLNGNILIEGVTFERLTFDNGQIVSVSDTPNMTIRQNRFVVSTGNGDITSLSFSGNSSAVIERNYFDHSAQNPRYSQIIVINDVDNDSRFRIHNNVMDASIQPANGDNLAIELRAYSGGTKNLRLEARNNLVLLGRWGTSAAFLGESSSNEAGTVTLVLENNLILQSPINGVGNSALVRGNSVTTFNVESIHSNNIDLDKTFVSAEAGLDLNSVAELESQFPQATGNLNIEMITAGYFLDSGNDDFRLSPTAPASIRTGGRNGASLGWPFSNDLLGVTRTGSGATGWSLGPYEYSE